MNQQVKYAATLGLMTALAVVSSIVRADPAGAGGNELRQSAHARSVPHPKLKLTAAQMDTISGGFILIDDLPPEFGCEHCGAWNAMYVYVCNNYYVSC
jgi:hypothetical protein